MAADRWPEILLLKWPSCFQVGSGSVFVYPTICKGEIYFPPATSLTMEPTLVLNSANITFSFL